MKATTTVVVGGVSLTRATGDAKVGDSADASKFWADATVRTDILNAAGTVITTAVAGTVVHDKVYVARTAGTPARCRTRRGRDLPSLRDDQLHGHGGEPDGGVDGGVAVDGGVGYVRADGGYVVSGRLSG